MCPFKLDIWKASGTHPTSIFKAADVSCGSSFSNSTYGHCAADSGNTPSCRDAIGTNTMAETVANDRPPAARAAVSRRRSAEPATVSASALALHLDCSRTHIGKLEAKA